MDKNNVDFADPSVENKKGKSLLLFAQRHPDTFGITKKTHPRI